MSDDITAQIYKLMNEREAAVLEAKMFRAQLDVAVNAFNDASRLRSEIQQARIKAEHERDKLFAESASLVIERNKALAEVERLHVVVEKLNNENDHLHAEAREIIAERERDEWKALECGLGEGAAYHIRATPLVTDEVKP